MAHRTSEKDKAIQVLAKHSKTKKEIDLIVAYKKEQDRQVFMEDLMLSVIMLLWFFLMLSAAVEYLL